MIFNFFIPILADIEPQNNESTNPQDFIWDQRTVNDSHFQESLQHLNNILKNIFTTQRSSKQISTLTQEVATTASPGNVSKKPDYLHFALYTYIIIFEFKDVIIIHLQDQRIEKRGARVSQ